MARPRFATADAQLRERILDSARLEFAKNGYETASLNRILLAAGLSKGAFYYYFDDKLDLAATLLLHDVEAQQLHELNLGTPGTVDAFWEELRVFTLRQLSRFQADRVRYDAMLRLANVMLREPAFAARVVPYMKVGKDQLGLFLAHGQQLGAVRRDVPLPALLALLADSKTSLYKSLYPGDHVMTEAELESFNDLMLDLMKRVLTPALPKEKP